MKILSRKEYKKLKSVENAAKRYAQSIKKGWDTSLKLMYYRRLWNQVAEELGVLNNDEVSYKVETGEDYSHGYNFGDAIS